MEKDSIYKKEPEELHNLCKETDKKSVDTFVNPGTHEKGLVTEADRKTGRISGEATQKLRDHASPRG